MKTKVNSTSACHFQAKLRNKNEQVTEKKWGNDAAGHPHSFFYEAYFLPN